MSSSPIVSEVKAIPVISETPSSSCRVAGGDVLRPFVLPDTGDRRGETGDGVVVVALGTVAGGAVGDEVEPRQPLLRGLDEVDPLSADVDGVAADLGDRLGGAGEELGVVAHDVAGPVFASGLLVGEEGDDEVAAGLQSLADHIADRSDDHRVHVLHVHGPPPPQQTVLDDAGEGVDAPVVGGGRDDVGVAVDDEGGGRRIDAGDPGDQRRPAGSGFDDRRRQPHLGEPALDELSGRAFRVRLVHAPVLGVDADELLAQGCDLVLGGTEIKHGDSPSTRRR